MTARQGYEIIKKKHLVEELRGCLEFVSFYLYMFAPIALIGESVMSGTVYDAVDKKTGRIFKYDITDDPDAFLNAKEIKIQPILDEKVGDIFK